MGCHGAPGPETTAWSRPEAQRRPHPPNGILFVLKTGCPWEDVPRADGAPTTCWRRFQAWTADGTWEGIWRLLLSQLDAQGKLEWTQAFLDGSFVPAKKGDLGAAKRKSAKAVK
jgi:transposase